MKYLRRKIAVFLSKLTQKNRNFAPQVFEALRFTES
jgi:hypothetical protein